MPDLSNNLSNNSGVCMSTKIAGSKDRYCTCCGKKLIQKDRHTGFDPMSGLPVYVTTWRCSDWRWWKLFTCHDSYGMSHEEW